MKGVSKMTQAELTAYVQSHLRKYKINVTLSGRRGSCINLRC